MTNEPFRPEDVLYRFTPTKEERAHFGYTALIELMVVTAYPYVDWNNLRLVARFPFGLSPLRSLESGVISVLFAHLLRERADLTSERNGWMDTAQMFEQQRDEARDMLTTIRAIRERELAELTTCPKCRQTMKLAPEQGCPVCYYKEMAGDYGKRMKEVVTERDGYRDALEEFSEGVCGVKATLRKETEGGEK